MRIGMHVKYYFKPFQGRLKVDCLLGTGLARPESTGRYRNEWTSCDILSPPLLLCLFWQILL